LIRVAYIKFQQALVNYETFLCEYNETPRSKIVKKYKPLLEPLAEVSIRQEVGQSTFKSNTLSN